MMPYSIALMLDNTSNYGLVKTETLFGFVSPNNTLVDVEPLEWIVKPSIFERRSVQETSRSITRKEDEVAPRSKRTKKSKKHKQGKKKIKKYHKRKHKFKMAKKFKKIMIPLILGLLVAKIILMPVAMKVLAIVAIKGLMMGVFSTVLATILALKSIFEHSQVQHRKDEGYTQVDVIKVPSKTENHVFYDDYRRKDDIIDDWV